MSCGGHELFYTTHYYGRSLAELIELLEAHGVKTIVDTRSKPTSRRPEFSSQSLQAELEKHSITYVWIPELGCPADLRTKAWRSGDYSELWAWYREKVLGDVFWKCMVRLRGLPKPVAFMCVEQDPVRCHRHLIAQALTEAGNEVSEI